MFKQTHDEETYQKAQNAKPGLEEVVIQPGLYQIQLVDAIFRVDPTPANGLTMTPKTGGGYKMAEVTEEQFEKIVSPRKFLALKLQVRIGNQLHPAPDLFLTIHDSDARKNWLVNKCHAQLTKLAYVLGIPSNQDFRVRDLLEARKCPYAVIGTYQPEKGANAGKIKNVFEDFYADKPDHMQVRGVDYDVPVDQSAPVNNVPISTSSLTVDDDDIPF
jgi:hypothetical protein